MPRASPCCDLHGQLDAFVAQPDMHLPHALELGKLGEDELQCILHALVRILLDPVAPGFHIAGGDTEEQRAAARLLLQRLLRALAEQRQLELAHRAFRTRDILPSNSRLKSLSSIHITRMPALASRSCVISFTPATRTSWSNCRMAAGCCCRLG